MLSMHSHSGLRSIDYARSCDRKRQGKHTPRALTGVAFACRLVINEELDILLASLPAAPSVLATRFGRKHDSQQQVPGRPMYRHLTGSWI